MESRHLLPVARRDLKKWLICVKISEHAGVSSSQPERSRGLSGVIRPIVEAQTLSVRGTKAKQSASVAVSERVIEVQSVDRRAELRLPAADAV